MKIFKSANLNSLALKSGSIYMLSNIMISSLSIITAPIFTRLLSTQDYGIASNFASWVNIGLVVVGLGLSYTIGNAKNDYPDESKYFLASIQTLTTLFGLVILFIVILFKDRLSIIMSIDSDLVIIIFIYLLFLPSVIYSQESFKFQLRYKENILITLFASIGSIFFCLIFINYIFKSNKYIGRILGLIMPFFIMGLFFYFKIFLRGWTSNITKYWKYALKISIPMVPHALSMLVLTQMDRIMIVKICGHSDAGLFSFGYTYAVLLSLVSNAILQAFQPWLYIKYKNNEFIQIKDATNFITLGMCLLTVFIVAFAPEALMILGSKPFWASKYIVMPIAVSALFQYLYNTYAAIELYYKKTIVIALGTFIAAIINFTLNYFFIPIYGYRAAAFATLIGYICLAIFHLIAYKKIASNQIFGDIFLWIVITTTGIFCYLLSLTYETFLIRYLIIISFFSIIGILLYYTRKKLLYVYNSISK